MCIFITSQGTELLMGECRSGNHINNVKKQYVSIFYFYFLITMFGRPIVKAKKSSTRKFFLHASIRNCESLPYSAMKSCICSLQTIMCFGLCYFTSSAFVAEKGKKVIEKIGIQNLRIDLHMFSRGNYPQVCHIQWQNS